MNKLEITSHGFRRARTRSLIQLGGLVEKSGLLETFQISLGEDLQRDPETKEPVAALFKGLLVLNEIANSDEMHLSLWTSQGLEALASSKK
ncbi:MAG TPA: conjugal transfer protein TraD [Alphaproteobacteria bacterium]|nr:conjugal transfer protein TraD [Alphaproteobacteria bacterium]